MDKATLSTVENGIEKKLEDMVSRGKSLSAYLNRTLLFKYQQAQIDRWQSENASEGDQWKPLTRPYQKLKQRKFAAYPGAGNALMIATGRLSQGATLQDSSYYYKKITDSSFEVGMNLSALPYARYPGRVRPYMKFSRDTISDWKRGISSYINGRST